MSYHIVTIDSPRCSISCRDGQLTCTTPEGDRRLPIEDVATIIISSFSAQIHCQLFLEAAKHGIAVIICEAFKPLSLVLPANRSTDTMLSRAQVALDERKRERLWQMTVNAKCRNQALLAAQIAPDDPNVHALVSESASRKAHKEASCAKLFWRVFGRAAGQKDFTRDRSLPGLNSLLNYGYAILLSTVLQKLLGVGLDPTFGLSHVQRERATPLGYDLMEPFRPFVDWRVAQWIRKEVAGPEGWAVTREFRRWVTGFPFERTEYLGFDLEVRGCIEGVVRGFRRAVFSNDPRFYKPWTPKSSKWVG